MNPAAIADRLIRTWLNRARTAEERRDLEAHLWALADGRMDLATIDSLEGEDARDMLASGGLVFTAWPLPTPEADAMRVILSSEAFRREARLTAIDLGDARRHA